VKQLSYKSLEASLGKLPIHEEWESAYRTYENELFYGKVFDYLIRLLEPPTGATFLDAGCGVCAHSIRLARRGFYVHSIDFSENIIEKARAVVKSSGVCRRIKIERQNILALNFPDESFDYILCWGVLMHIPDAATAIAELARIIRGGGKIIISESNLYSLDSLIQRTVNPIFGEGKGSRKKTPAGIEYWEVKDVGELMTRHSNCRWLINEFGSHRLFLKKRFAGQFTELYTRCGQDFVKKVIHSFNNLWFDLIKSGSIAFGNVFIFEKK
jgi:SAM-dependent methyltransferase